MKGICEMCEGHLSENNIDELYENKETKQMVCNNCLVFWNKPLKEKYDKVLWKSEEMENMFK